MFLHTELKISRLAFRPKNSAPQQAPHFDVAGVYAMDVVFITACTNVRNKVETTLDDDIR